MNDIRNESDVQLLVNTFYHKVKSNTLLNPIFENVAKIDWDHHLPKMYDFWTSILLGKSVYKGNPIPKHVDLNFRVKLTPELFNQWLMLFSETIDELFSGSNADEAKVRAQSIAEIMRQKIDQDELIVRKFER